MKSFLLILIGILVLGFFVLPDQDKSQTVVNGVSLVIGGMFIWMTFCVMTFMPLMFWLERNCSECLVFLANIVFLCVLVGTPLLILFTTREILV